MKNNDKEKFLLISLKRQRKLFKRKRKKNIHINEKTTSLQRFRIKYENKVIANFKSKLFEFLVENRFINGDEEILTKIPIPHKFCLDEYYDETIETIAQIAISIWENIGKDFIIDFSKCVYVGQSALFLLQILRLELQSDFNDLNKRLSVLNSKIDIKIIKSINRTVNLNLLLCGYFNDGDEFELEEGVTPINSLGYLKGQKQQKSYLENKKGINATKIVDYLNECLIRNSFELSETGVNDITGMIGEILSNAEDHSPFSSYYVTANYTQINDSIENVGLLNLSFLNFGYSIYEGFLETKDVNFTLFNELQKGCEILQMSSPFSEENLFTLFALQDGVSRLKFKDESRGTGTMKFINCFFSFGDYQNTNKQQSPILSILSGNTQLICDNKYKPFIDDNKCYVSLNDHNDLSLPPNKSHLKNLKYKFPGTLLSVRAFLNKEHISNKISNNE